MAHKEEVVTKLIPLLRQCTETNAFYPTRRHGRLQTRHYVTLSHGRM
jgi:hypothetical protein